MSGLLVVDDDRTIVRIFQRCFEASNIAVYAAASGAEALKVAREMQPDVVVLDMVLPDQSGLSTYDEIRQVCPGLPIIFITAAGSSDATIESIQRGAMDYLRKPLDMARIREVVRQALVIGDLTRAQAATGDSGHSAATASIGKGPSDALIGRCPAMQEVYKAIGRVADQNVNVLIRGESGTGKEVVARAIHRHSSRSAEKFLAVNCAAIPESLLESELFGHEKGAFTGATAQRLGKFEECDGGTLFLDEIGDMPLHMQSKVLRAIQEKEFQRVGGNSTITSDVRILAATNRDLEAMVSSGEFRADLCFRLNGYTVVLPPLRERREDIVPLVAYYLERFNAEIGKAISAVAPETMERLERYCWPGNIRELQTVLKHSMLHAMGPVLLPEFLPPELSEAASTTAAAPSPASAGDAQAATAADQMRQTEDRGRAFHEFIAHRLREGTSSLYAECVERMEGILLTDVLKHTNGNQSQAALLLGITRGCLRSKLKSHGIVFRTSVAIREPAETVSATE
jgi:DNA-binding NtrC family response regulator